MNTNSNIFKLGVIMINVLAVCVFGFVLHTQNSSAPTAQQELSTEAAKVVEPVAIHLPAPVSAEPRRTGVARVRINKASAQRAHAGAAHGLAEPDPMRAVPMSHYEGLFPAEAMSKALNFLELREREAVEPRVRLLNEHEKAKVQGASVRTQNNRR